MTPNDVLKLLEIKTGITPLKFSADGVVSFTFNDHITTHLEKSKDEQTMTIYGIIGLVPLEQTGPCFTALLEANLFGSGTAGGAFGVDSEKQEIIFYKTYELQHLQSENFFESLKQFLLAQEHWTKFIQNRGYEISHDAPKKNVTFGSGLIKL